MSPSTGMKLCRRSSAARHGRADDPRFRRRPPALVEPDVESLGTVLGRAPRSPAGPAPSPASLVRRGLGEGAHVPVDDRHQVAGGIRKSVQDQEGVLAPGRRERSFVVGAGEGIAENTPVTACRRRSDVASSARAPRGDSHRRARGQPLTSSRSRFPTLKNGTRFSGTSTAEPVLGLRPFRELRWRIRKLPKPRSSTLSPFDKRVGDVVEDRVDDRFRLLLGQVRDLGNLVDQVGFRHRLLPSQFGGDPGSIRIAS